MERIQKLNNMKYLSHYIEQAQTKVFDDCGAFFAFGQNQFDEQKKAGVTYVQLGGGMLCPKDKAGELVERLTAVHKAGIEQDIAENGIDGIIKRELANHEAYYTGDISSTMDALESYNIATADIARVYNAERKANQD